MGSNPQAAQVVRVIPLKRNGRLPGRSEIDKSTTSEHIGSGSRGTRIGLEVFGRHESGGPRLPTNGHTASQRVLREAGVHNHVPAGGQPLDVSRTEVSMDHSLVVQSSKTRCDISAERDQLMKWPVRTAVAQIGPVEVLLEPYGRLRRGAEFIEIRGHLHHVRMIDAAKKPDFTSCALKRSWVCGDSEINQLQHQALARGIGDNVNLFLTTLHQRTNGRDVQQIAGGAEKISHAVQTRTARVKSWAGCANQPAVREPPPISSLPVSRRAPRGAFSIRSQDEEMRDAVAVSRHGVNWVVGIGSLLLVVVSAAVTYWTTLASQTSGPASAYPGWITVLQPTLNSTSTQFRISVDALSGGSHPRMSYRVTACGAGTSSGYLVAGGASVLGDDSLDGAIDNVEQLGVGDLRVSGPFSSTPKSLGPVQAWRFEFSHLPACIGKPGDQEFIGTGFRVEGLASKPVSRSEWFGPFRGATETWAMPYVGNLPGAGHNLGAFELSGLVSGSFLRPPALASDVDAGAIALKLSMRDARPATVASDRARWHEVAPFQPTVRVENSSAAAVLQRLSTSASIVLGLAGAILTAYVFELVRRRPLSGAVPAGDRAGAAAPNFDPLVGPGRRPQNRLWWLPIVAATAVAAVLHYVTSRRSRID